MLKKLRIILGLVFVVVLCASLAACKAPQELNRYDVLVYYDSNGGKYGNRGGITVVNGFRFSDYETDDEGNYHFKLVAPTVSDRFLSTLGLTKSNNFYLDWYRTREIVRDDEGNILDSEGRTLVEDVDDYDGTSNYYVVDSEGDFLGEFKGTVDGKYIEITDKVVKRNDGVFYIITTELAAKRIISEPLYTYDDKWDFANDEVICNPEEGKLVDGNGNVIAEKNKDGKYELRLYAGWIPYFYFDFYTEVDGEWVKYGETYFDYSVVNSNNQYDTLWTPRWADGVMQHVTDYKDADEKSYSYTFPKKENSTFIDAFTDEACTQKIDGSFKHPGTVNRENAVATNRVQNIYVKVKPYEEYHIQTAEQLSKNANLAGHYLIYSDLLEFDKVKWPEKFVSGEFKGTFEGVNGQVTITGVAADFFDPDASYGGLFGRIGAGAVVKGLNFVDAKLDITVENLKQVCTIGLFSGEIDDNARVSDIIISGENTKILLGKIAKDADCTVNMLVGGENKAGVTNEDGVQLWAYGEFFTDTRYYFFVNPDSTSIDGDGDVKISFTDINNRYKPEEFIYITTFGGK